MVRSEDKVLLRRLLGQLHPAVAAHARVVVLTNLQRPANLPFHLLAWTQGFLKAHNCGWRRGDSNEQSGVASSSAYFKEHFSVCSVDVDKLYHGGRPESSPSVPHILSSRRNGSEAPRPIRFVYYTESDQVLRFDGPEVLAALTALSNSSCFFTGRRREKSPDSAPEAYMAGLDRWRNCGVPGYGARWPGDDCVRRWG